MRRLLLLAASAAPIFAQLPAPNDAGVVIGHVHLIVRDAPAQIKAWSDVFGAKPEKAGPLQLLKLPGVFLIVNQGESNGGSDGSTVNHIGIAVKDFADIKVRLDDAKIPMKETTPNQEMVATFPEGVRVEIMEDKNLATPVAFHALHLSVADPEAERAWYVKNFGAKAMTHHNVLTAMMPASEIVFGKAEKPPAGTKGRALDHIGFEVKDLEKFCKALQANGLKFDFDFHDLPRYGLKVAFVTDPAGTFIELTEGLAAK